ncbi:coiled-coil domain-containing protein [Priestia aryabhattai]
MTTKDLQAVLTHSFKDDRLWIKIHELKLEKYLFPKMIFDTLEVGDKLYPLSKIANMVGKKTQNVRNNLDPERTPLNEYFQASKERTRWVLDYKAAFRIHMYFILQDYSGQTPREIASYLGLETEQMQTSNLYNVKKTPESNNSNELLDSDPNTEIRLQKVELQLTYMNWASKLDAFKQDYQEAKRKVAEWELMMQVTNMQIELEETKRRNYRLENKEALLLQETLKKVDEKNNKNNRAGFLKAIFSKNTAQAINYEEIYEEVVTATNKAIEEMPPNQKLKETEKKLEELRDARIKLEKSKENLTSSEEEKKKIYQEFKRTFENFKEQLENSQLEVASSSERLENVNIIDFNK